MEITLSIYEVAFWATACGLSFVIGAALALMHEYNTLRRGYEELQNAIEDLATHGAEATSIVVVSGPDRHEVVCRFVTTRDAQAFHQVLRKCGDIAMGLSATHDPECESLEYPDWLHK